MNNNNMDVDALYGRYAALDDASFGLRMIIEALEADGGAFDDGSCVSALREAAFALVRSRDETGALLAAAQPAERLAAAREHHRTVL